MNKCPICGMEVDNLEEHKKNAHPEAAGMGTQTKTKCPICRMEVENLEEHKKNSHPGM